MRGIAAAMADMVVTNDLVHRIDIAGVGKFLISAYKISDSDKKINHKQ